MQTSFVFPKYFLTCLNVEKGINNTFNFEGVFEKLDFEKDQDEIEFSIIMGLEYTLLENEDRTIRIEVIGPTKEAENFEDSITLEPCKRKHRRFVFQSLRVTEFKTNVEGMYQLRLYHGEKIISKHEFFLRRRKNGSNDN